MGRLTVETCPLEGLKVVTPAVAEDDRGYFMETYQYEDFRNAGIPTVFLQDNQSSSKKGVLRGLHFQKRFPQAKLVRVIRGEVFDVAVDLREGSPTFGRWHGVFLSARNRRQLYIPERFAHGFLVLSEEAEFCYKCSELYHPDDEGGIFYQDPEIGIEWPFSEGMVPVLSEKDRKWGGLSAYLAQNGI
ncbi:MAG: dTDP-4-dehydrorhamnose 3,5-epimerase [Clostridium sp.]|jgi:dTDP-4-dehydrorhamnose 3,5-epimerase|nr:dTDP-4-dehydrorhamnose 3,5-epimerase [Clostridium sp.]